MRIVLVSALFIVLVLAGCSLGQNSIENPASLSMQNAGKAANQNGQSAVGEHNGIASKVDKSKFKAKPFIYDPGKTGIIVSAWVRHTGLPDGSGPNYGLVLQKNGPTAVNAAAGAVITGATGARLTQLGFDYYGAGHCGAGSPRFNVTVGSTLYYFGCVYGTHTDLGNGWIRVRFNGSEPGAGGFGGIIASISIVADEGTDILGQGTPGQSVLDNIDVNGVLIGNPGNAGHDNQKDGKGGHDNHKNGNED
jgi:hypothetical protein